MIRALTWVVLLAAAPLFAANVKFKDDQQIQEMHGAFWNSWNRHETSALVAGFFADATYVTLDGKMVQGKAEIEKAFQSQHSGQAKESSVKTEGLKIQFISRNVALTDQNVEMIGLKEPGVKDPEPIPLHAVSVMAKKDGKWSIQAFRPYLLKNGGAP